MSDTHFRIAMWSGPRNISTAMMRAWGARPDTFVCDEPLYAHYLKTTNVAHPGRDDVIAHHETDWRRVVRWIAGDPLELPSDMTGLTAGSIADRTIFYQKHMAHHLLPHIDRSWMAAMTNCFLIREPREMLLSLVKNVPRPRIEDTGLPQQAEIFKQVQQNTGRTPPVLDARDVLTDPRGALAQLCMAIGVKFDESMLSWMPGRRATDGIWAKHWYDAVDRSTGFEAYQPKTEALPIELFSLHAECERYYDELHAARIVPA